MIFSTRLRILSIRQPFRPAAMQEFLLDRFFSLDDADFCQYLCFPMAYPYFSAYTLLDGVKAFFQILCTPERCFVAHTSVRKFFPYDGMILPNLVSSNFHFLFLSVCVF